MKNNGKSYFINLLIVAFSIIIPLYLVEIILAYNQSEQFKKQLTPTTRNIRLREHSPNIDRYIRPEPIYIKRADNLINHEFPFKTDIDGYIYNGYNHDKADLNLLFLGGSTTECLYVKEENRFPYLTSRLLENKLGDLKINSFNSGVSGNNSMHSINILLNKGLKKRPDYIFLMHNNNDLDFLLKGKDYWSNWDTSRQGKSLIVDKKIEKNINIKDLVRKLVNSTFPSIYNRATILKANLSKDKKNQSLDALEFKIKDPQLIRDQIESNLKTFINITKSWNSTPVLMTQASRFIKNPDGVVKEYIVPELISRKKMSYEEFIEIYSSINQLIRKVAKEEKVILVDLAELIPSTSEYMYDSLHFNDKGSSLAAKHISEVISLAVINKYNY